MCYQLMPHDNVIATTRVPNVIQIKYENKDVRTANKEIPEILRSVYTDSRSVRIFSLFSPLVPYNDTIEGASISK